MTTPSRFSIARGGIPTNVLRVAGAALVILVLFPLYRRLDAIEGRLVLKSILIYTELARTMLLYGSLIVILIALVIARLLDPDRIEEWCASLGRRLAAIPSTRFALGLALLATLVTLGFSYFVLAGKPTVIDAMVQMLQARFVAAGQLGGPADQFTEFWQLQNSLITPNGWVSQYPPGHVFLLALGFLLRVPILVGPALMGITVLFTTLSAQRLLRDDAAVARVGAIMLALSPFFIGLAGAYMNHVSAAAAVAIAVYCALRSEEDERLRWPLFTGAALGLAFSVRPLTAIVAGATVLAMWIVVRDSRRTQVKGWVRLFVAAAIGATPFVIAAGAYNNHFFGSPFRFGYVAAQGPLVGLGFHNDPYGNYYGPVEAVAYTSSDLTTLSLYLLETPLPAVIVVGLFLAFRRRFSTGEQLIALWALLPVVANGFYWHHGVFMGPRMLNEAAPAWALATAMAAVGLVRQTPRRQFGGYSPRAMLTVAFMVAWTAGIFYLAPGRLMSYGGAWMASSRIEPPHTASPSLIFVHGAWSGRVVMRLIANGLRLDSLDVGIRQNTTCEFHEFANWYAAAKAGHRVPRPDIGFDPASPRRPPQFMIGEDNQIRAEPGRPLSRDCVRQIASDSAGIIDISSFLWQTDLPGLPGDGTMIVRDMGPEANAKLIARYPDRTPLFFYRAESEGKGPQLVPYAEGLRRLWH
ncbi:MAG: glycosyltransferase family 39 protein [Gemmatimonadaceae bacterium]